MKYLLILVVLLPSIGIASEVVFPGNTSKREGVQPDIHRSNQQHAVAMSGIPSHRPNPKTVITPNHSHQAAKSKVIINKYAQAKQP
ncbi:hypothetical protein BN59_01709 [Legionella massiliensis]|uniref:Uncharacterized protein n=1 Tax=Legionella massiliensis TaxID=1034943 RepID=A0A078KWU9_9GAMM|nr:hypothetical protein [Legionella massiliensis]CDZ77426.1 hypothetical protein BN59_01709 [Legionella massiliensis]CEE13164.1 hypothetical protein BN1094_01709 [Legionella massiliensis]